MDNKLITSKEVLEVFSEFGVEWGTLIVTGEVEDHYHTWVVGEEYTSVDNGHYHAVNVSNNNTTPAIDLDGNLIQGSHQHPIVDDGIEA